METMKGTALVLAGDSIATSYLAGKFTGKLYNAYGEIDLVAGAGTGRICK